MVTPKIKYSGNQKTSLWYQDWFPPVAVSGPEQMAVLQPISLSDIPTKTAAFSRIPKSESDSEVLAHGYVGDKRLAGLYRDPSTYLNDFSRYGAVVCPDFSMHRHMPRHERVRSSWASRAVGAYFQTHGLKVVPNVRWGFVEDLTFVLDGLPMNSAVAISTQTLRRDGNSMRIFREGLRVVMEGLQPEGVLLYGSAPTSILEVIQMHATLRQVPTDIARVFHKGDV